MSLNRSEQLLYDYVRTTAMRDTTWHKVRAIVAGAHGAAQGGNQLDSELWRYLEERSAGSRLFAAVPLRAPERTSMKNLAEYLVRLWTQPRPAKPAPNGRGNRS